MSPARTRSERARGRLVLVVTGLEQPGGVARAARALARAVQDVAIRRHLDVEIHALNDPPDGSPDINYVSPSSVFVGYGGSWSQLARRVLFTSVPSPPSAVVFNHVNLSPLGVALRLRGVPYAVVTHGVEVWRPLAPHRAIALRVASSIWSVSRYTAHRASALHGVRPERVDVVRNCLDPHWCAQTPRAAPPEPTPYVLTVSRLDPDEDDKGVELLIRAFCAIYARSPTGWRLLVAGDGADRPRLQRVAATLDVERRIHFVGRVPDERLAELYSGCELFCLPSRKEGFGLVFVEAMAHGRPVVAANAGGAPEVVRDGVDGLLVSPSDVASLSSALGLLMDSEALRDRLGAAGRARALETFGYCRYVEDVGGALARLLS